MADDPFKPIAGYGRRSPPAAKDRWTAIVPVPKNAPTPPARHYKRGAPSVIYTYRDALGWPIGYVWRFDGKDGSKEFLPLTYCKNEDGRGVEWRWKAWPEPRPLYGRDSLAKLPNAPVVVCEGEKVADAAGALLLQYVAVTSPGGSQSAASADWAPLAKREVVIWPDADEPGAKYAETVKRLLAPLAASVKIVSPPPEVKSGWDAADALAEGWDTARAESLIATAAIKIGPHLRDDDADDGEDETGRSRRPRIADILVQLATQPDVELWQSPSGEGYATVPVRDHLENWPIASDRFKKWLINRHRRSSDRSIPSHAVNDACANLDAIATERPTFKPQLRIARHGDALYVDLADDRWRAVKVTQYGWEVVERPPVKFIRAPSMRPLPEPEPGGSLDALRNFIAFKNDDHFRLVAAFVVGAYQPDVPQMVLAVYGIEGSGKTYIVKLVRRLIDPNEVEIEGMPKTADDMLPVLRESWLVAYDNVSVIPPWFSDMMCQISTGRGATRRKLYTNEEAVRRAYKRPQEFSAIPEAIVKGDLASRSITVIAPKIEERRREAELDAAFAQAHPLLFGAILDAVVSALRHSDEEPPDLPRMADFTTWVWRARLALGWSGYDFLRAYCENQKAATEVVFEGDSFAHQILVFMKGLAKIADRTGFPEPTEQKKPVSRTMEKGVVIWTGTSTALLAELPATETERKQKWWPNNENQVRSRLRRSETALGQQGIGLELDIPGRHYGRLLRIEGDIKRLVDEDAESDKRAP